MATSRPHLLTRAIDTLDALALISGALGTLVIWVLAATVVYDVTLRSLGVPNLWASETSIYMMMGFAFLGVGATQRVDGHFRVTFVRDLCPPKVRVALDAFALTLSLALAVGFTLGAWRLASFSLMLDFRTSTLLQVPMWILQGFLVVGGVLLTLAVLRDLILLVRDGAAARDRSGAAEAL